MGRRRQSGDAAFAEAVVGLALLFGLGWTFSPQFRAVILLLIFIALFGLAIWVCYRVLKKPAAPRSDSPNYELQQAISPDNTASPIRPPTTAEKLHAIDWFQFEKLVEIIYQHQGFSVQRLGGAKPDGGVDLIIESAQGKFIVQCKHWRKWAVGVRHIREFLGAMTDSKIQNGIFITLSGYSGEAKQLADKNGIKILNESDVVGMLEESGLINSQEVSSLLYDSRKFCPKCEKEMVLRTARMTGKQFWGCSSFPRCKYILDFE